MEQYVIVRCSLKAERKKYNLLAIITDGKDHFYMKLLLKYTSV